MKGCSPHDRGLGLHNNFMQFGLDSYSVSLGFRLEIGLVYFEDQSFVSLI